LFSGAGGSTFSDPLASVLQISAAIYLAVNGFCIFPFRLCEQALNASWQNKSHFLMEVAALA